MARKKIGHIELQWTCPNCGSLNPGSKGLCGNCGSPQPRDVKFEQPVRQEIITDQEKIKQAEAGADIHCPYCGTRNPSNAKVCKQCGGDLSTGLKRETGQVLGTFKVSLPGKIICPQCGTENPDTEKRCVSCGGSLAQVLSSPSLPPDRGTKPPMNKSRMIPFLIGGLALICALLAIFIYFSSRTSGVVGVVQDVQWTRSIPIEALIPVEHQAWQDEIPSGGVIEVCRDEVRYVQDEPAPGAVEICGTPYTVDTGSGYGEVVQDCEYQVFDAFCTYTIEEWREVRHVSLSGSDYMPLWPDPQLQSGERQGENMSEDYQIIFVANGQTYTYNTSDFDLFQKAEIGSKWTLKINTFGKVISIEP